MSRDNTIGNKPLNQAEDNVWEVDVPNNDQAYLNNAIESDTDDAKNAITRIIRKIEQVAFNLGQKDGQGGAEAAGLISRNSATAEGKYSAKKEEKERKSFSDLLSRLQNSTAFKAFEAAFIDFKDAVDAAKANQVNIDEYMKAIEEEDIAEMKRLLEKDGIDTSKMDKTEIKTAALEKVTELIKDQDDLIKVMQEKAAIAQDKWDKFLDENPDIKNDPEKLKEARETFFQPFVEELNDMEELLKDQGKNLDFIKSLDIVRDNVGYEKTELLARVRGEHRHEEIAAPSSEQASVVNQADDLLGDDLAEFGDLSNSKMEGTYDSTALQEETAQITMDETQIKTAALDKLVEHINKQEVLNKVMEAKANMVTQEDSMLEDDLAEFGDVSNAKRACTSYAAALQGETSQITNVFNASSQDKEASIAEDLALNNQVVKANIQTLG